MSEFSTHSTQTCPYCKMGMTVHQIYHPGHCGTQPCILAHGAHLAKQHAKKIAVEKAKITAAQDHAATLMPAIRRALGCDIAAAIKVPYQDKPLAPISAEQRHKFLTYIAAEITAAYDSVQRAPVIGPLSAQEVEPPPAIETAACTACQGDCCSFAFGRHAFLSQIRFEEIFNLNPDLDVETALAFYTAALPQASVTEACVYQSGTGCTLPRDWRADVCNSYKCDNLKAAADIVTAISDMPVAIVGIGDDTAHVMAFQESRGLYEIDCVAAKAPMLDDML